MSKPIEQTPGQRIDSLDGLRALAALWVMYGHIHLYTFGWNHHSSPIDSPLNLLLYMHFGVNIFLVLSGFCLALPVVRNANRMRVSLPTYFKARALRILPPYYAALLLILLVNAFVPLAAWGRHPIGLTGEIPARVMWGNFLLMQDFFPHLNTINGPFWSIAIEWHLYFLFPLAVWLLHKFGAWTLMVTGAALALALTWRSLIGPLLFGDVQIGVPQPPYFVLLFILGIVAAWFTHGENSPQRMQKWSWLAWGVALLAMLSLGMLIAKYPILDGTTVHAFLGHLHLMDPLCGVIAAALLVGMFSLPASHRARRVLQAKPLVMTGGFSYSLYLIHIPILAAINRFIDLAMPAKSEYTAFLFLSIVGGGVSLLCAWGFAKVFETHLWRSLFTSGRIERDLIEARFEELKAENRRLNLRLEKIEAAGQTASGLA